MRDDAQLMSGGGIRSLSADDALYVPGEAGRGVNSNWRGPVWVPINYMIIEALADVDADLAADIRQRIVSNIERDWTETQRFHEYFDGDSGEGRGADFQTGWTALVANLIEEGWPVPTAE
jgi:glycogen debranching enzyme